MGQVRPGVRRLFQLALRHRGTVEGELLEEQRFHLEQRATQFVAEGMTPEHAWREAERRYGPTHEMQRHLRRTARVREGRMRVGDLVERMLQDARYVARQLARSPGFTLTIAVTLALGIGANATMFAVLDRLLLRSPSHVVAPDRVGRLALERRVNNAPSTQTAFSYADYRDLREIVGGEATAAYAFPQDVTLGRGAGARKLRGILVTPSYFRVLGPRPALGRFFTAEEGSEPVGQRVAIISHGFWQREFGGAAGVLGRQLLLTDAMYTVVGVAPRYFSGLGLGAADVWLPITSAPELRFAREAEWMSKRSSQWLVIIARLPNDSSRTLQLASTATQTLRAAMVAMGRKDDSVAVARFISVLRRNTAHNSADVRVTRLLLAVSVFVVLIACANVANLLLARGMRRRHEIGIRVAMGIGSTRLASLLLMEGALLALVGGAASLLVVHYGGAVVKARLLSSVTTWSASLVDRRVLLFTVVATGVVALLVGLAPVTQGLRTSLTDALRGATRGGGTRAPVLRGALLLVQIALCSVLLIGTGLFLRSLQNVNNLRLGIDTRDVLVVRLSDSRSTSGQVGGSTAQITGPERAIEARYLRLAERARVLPGVRYASVAIALPFSSSWSTRFIIPGRDELPRIEDGGPYYNAVDEHFFATLGTRIVRGRGITAEDRRSHAHVLVINETMARLYWPGIDPLGACAKIGADTMPCSTVIGIAENARRQQIMEGESMQYFVPLEVAPTLTPDRVMFVRASSDAGRFAGGVRKALQTAEPDLPYVDVQPMQRLLDAEMRPWALGSTMFTAFGAVALLLAVVGVYGVFAYDVAQRARELAVRMALGAQHADVVRLVMRRALVIGAVGIVAGALVALTGGRWSRDLLYGVSARDPVIFGLVVVVLVLSVTAATLVPAWRATRVQLREAMAAE